MVHCLRNPQQTRDTFAIPQEEEYYGMPNRVRKCFFETQNRLLERQT
jgi:hypothetical protein